MRLAISCKCVSSGKCPASINSTIALGTSRLNASESLIDEIVAATDKDPLALHQELLKDSPKHLAVLNAVAATDCGHPLTHNRSKHK